MPGRAATGAAAAPNLLADLRGDVCNATFEAELACIKDPPGAKAAVANFRNARGELSLVENVDMDEATVLGSQITDGVHPTVYGEMGRSFNMSDRVTLRPFAEAQAAFLEPPQQVVERLLDKLTLLRVGIVVELQEVLHAVKMGHNLLCPC